jgi:hypothetical protein
MSDPAGSAEYVFGVTVRFKPTEVDVSPDRFETTMSIPAPRPGFEGWRLFREWLWRGELTDDDRFTRVAEERLGLEAASGVDVVAVDFRELRTDRPYLDRLREAIAEDLEAYNADDVDSVLHKYLGSSIHVRE